MNKVHGLTGRPSNAKKYNPKEGIVTMRVSMDKKSELV